MRCNGGVLTIYPGRTVSGLAPEREQTVAVVRPPLGADGICYVDEVKLCARTRLDL